MKKRINTQAITNELSEGSVFFPPSKAPESPPLTTSEPMQPRNHDTVIPRDQDTMLPSSEEDIIETIRKTVKQIGKESATHRCTIEEKDASDDIVYLFKKHHIFTSDNEIRRIGTNFIIADYHKNGENSILAKVLKRLNS